MPIIEAGGVHIFCERFGNGSPTLLLTHGGFSTCHDFDLQVDPLSEHMRVYRYDRRGCGLSSGRGLPQTPETWSGDVIALMDKLGIPSAVLGGVSFGAMTSLEVALRYPGRVDGLVLAAGTASGSKGGPYYEVDFPRRLDDLGQITKPTLVIHGEQDPVFPLAQAQAMADGIAGAELVTLPTGHSPNLEAPEAFNQAIIDFVSRRF